MTPLLAAGCLLQIVDTDLSVTPTYWLEKTVYEVGAEPTCRFVEIPLPADAELISYEGKAHLGDSTKRKLVQERWVRRVRGVDGQGSLRAELPDLLGGDRVVIEVERRWHRADFVFAPGAARLVVLNAPASADLDVRGGEAKRDRALWAEDVAADFAVTVSSATPPTPAPVAIAPPAGDVARSRHLVLEVPDGNPQLLLYPGAGSQVRIEEFFEFPPSVLEQGVALPVAAGQALQANGQPESALTVERRPEVALLRVRPTEGVVRVSAAWVQLDAPTYGERPADLDELLVDAPEGSVAWEGDGWRLVDVRKAPILPSGQLLVKALDHRFRGVSQPEPGLPTDLRGGAATWELAALLRPTVFERARPGLDTDPLWPRKLLKARKSGALSSTEAMLILHAYARQAGLRSDWALARPASQGPGYRSSPAGYRHGLVRLGGGEDVRWVDPSCSVCGPFELPPDLEGADVLSLATDRTPDPTEGRLSMAVEGAESRWELSGPPALLLRMWLEDIPLRGRPAALAGRFGGPDAELVKIEGLGAAGQPVTLTLKRATKGLGLDPLALPTAAPDGFAWVDWVGTRVAVWPADDDPGPLEIESGPLHYVRTVDDEVVLERLTITDRKVPDASLRLLEALRRGL